MNVLQNLFRSTFGPILVTLNHPMHRLKHSPEAPFSTAIRSTRHSLYVRRTSCRRSRELAASGIVGLGLGMGSMRMDSLAGLVAVEGFGGEVPWEAGGCEVCARLEASTNWKDYEVRAFMMVGWLVELMKLERMRIVALETRKDDVGSSRSYSTFRFFRV